MKSRDILMGCPGTFLFLELVALLHAALLASWWWAGSSSEGLVVPGGVEDEVAEDLAGVAVDDGDVEVVDEHADVGSGVLGAEADVVQASAAPEGDLAAGVRGVVADAEVAAGVVVGGGLGAGGIDLGRPATVEGAVLAPLVVVGGELVEQGLEGGEVLRGGPGMEPLLEGPVETLDLALGLGVVRGAVLLRDAELEQLDLEGVRALPVAGGEHESVVRQRRLRGPVDRAGGAEGRDDDWSGNASMGGGGEQEPGVVVDPEQHLGVGAVGQGDVGEVGLPALVRQVGLEPDPGPLGPLARLGRDDARTGQDPPDRRHPGRGVHLVIQDAGDRVRSGVAAVRDQVRPQRQDPANDVRRRRIRVRAGPSRLRLEGVPATGPPGRDQLGHPWLGDPVEPSHLALRLARQDRFHDDPLLRHAANGRPSGDKHVAGHPINMSWNRTPEAAPYVKSRDIVNPRPGTSFMPGVSSSCGRRAGGGL